MTAEVRRARTAFLRLGVMAPLMLLGLSLAVVLVWMPQLPDPVAIHWSGSGPDGFGPRWTATLPSLIGIGMVLVAAATVLIVHRVPPGTAGERTARAARAPWSATARFLGAMNLGLAAFIASLTVVAAGIQRGLSDAADAPEIAPWLFLAVALLLIGAILGWVLQPPTPPFTPRPISPEGTPILASETVAWFGEVSMARSGKIVLGTALALLTVLAAVTFALDPRAGGIVLATLLLVLVAIACTVVFRVRVNAEGLRVRSLIGWPSTRIPLADVERVQITDIDPFSEFGGWGWRIGLDGRRGVVMRKGEALQVTHGGRVFVVTVDGAAEAAAVLEGLRARR